MRILIHTDEYYPTCAACAYRMKSFSDAFAANGNEVTVITSSVNKNNGKLEAHNEKILFSPTVRMKKKTALMRMLNNLSFAFTSVLTALKAGKADVVITTSPPPLVSFSGWLISKIKRAKLVYDVRDIWPDVALEMGSFGENSFYCKLFTSITSFMYRHADMVTTVSPGKVEKIKDKLSAAHAQKVILVGNGFDENILNSKIDEEIISKYDLHSGFTCVYIGNIGLAQGLDSVLQVAAATAHKDVKFLLFGTGAEKDSLEKAAKEAGLDNVTFCGVIPHDKVYTILTHAQLSFIPLKSAKMKDSVPTKVYESLGVGCPVLLVAEGNACDIVNESKMGCCVSPERSKELVSVFDGMVDNYGDICANRTNAQDLIRKKYSRRCIADNFEIQLKNLINEKKEA